MNQKIYFFTITLLTSIISINAQVGVNTNDPKSTLHINSSSTPPNTSSPDGLLIPKLSKSDLASKTNGTYGTNQNGTLIYVTNTNGGSGSSATQVTEITGTGFYYFSSSSNKWLPIIPTTLDGLYTNIYTANDKIKDNRIVNQTTNNSQIFFNSSIVNAFSIGNNNQLSVDTSNSRVGFGTSTPSVVTEMNNLTIKDGNEKNKRVLTNVALSVAGSGLAADNNLLGVGTWIDVESGNAIVEGEILPDNLASVTITESRQPIPSRVKLNKGKWLVFAGFMSEVDVTPSYESTLWIQTSIVRYPNAATGDYSSPQVLETNNTYGAKLLSNSFKVSSTSAPGIINGKGQNFIKGVVPIEVLNDNTYIGFAEYGFSPATPGASYKVINIGENYLYALQIP